MEENKLIQTNNKKGNKIMNILLSFAIVILTIILGVKINFSEVVVNGNSMYPTLKGNSETGYEFGYTDRFIFKITGLDRYDIVVVKNNNELWIKRIIGMPNETVQIIEGEVYINDKRLEDDYYCEYFIEEPGIANTKLTLGDDEYFVMGDNRNHSTDSRSPLLGIVKYKQIYGHSFISRGYCNSTVCDYKISKHRFEIKGW